MNRREKKAVQHQNYLLKSAMSNSPSESAEKEGKMNGFTYTIGTEKTLRFVYCDAAEAHWWLMLEGGQFYGIQSLDGEGCLAILEEYLRHQGIKHFRLTWKPKGDTEKTFKAWCKKWARKVAEGYIS